ncbi:DUF6886 family protein [Kribbella deserti]|uniref:DUF6886 family protein n=1 Tax=Kribbella deserti TaxID=1926257 RepID=A0ABV6QGT2_9ACTN
MRPAPGEVLHFSEDPGITRFSPRVVAVRATPLATPYVWAVDADRAPDYWFPRQCPRALAWVGPASTENDRLRLIGPGETRVHAIEYGWLEAMRTVELYAYRLPAETFTPYDAAVVSTAEEILPLGPPERVPDLFTLHAQAGIQLRVLPNLHPFWSAVTASTLPHSAIRLRNALPPPP